MPRYERQVFVNVPFDRRYQKLFHALVFAVHDCGFHVRCALESSDSSQVRVEKLLQLIDQCRFGIHDLSRTSLDSANRLPRFNMPLELGLFLGAKRFGNARQRRKHALILDSAPYRYQKYCSDIAGQDIRAHGNTVAGAIAGVRSWLRDIPGHPRVRGEVAIEQRYYQFRREIPAMCRERGVRLASLSFRDYQDMVLGWQLENVDFRFASHR